MIVVLIVCSVLLVSVTASDDGKAPDLKLISGLSKQEEYLRRGFDWFGDRFLGFVESFVLDGRAERSNGVEGRKHKKVKLNKYVFPLIIGFLLIKSVVLPLALKALAILSGKAVVLSLMSLILASIIGLRQMAHHGGHHPAQSKIDLINVPLTKYRRKDILDQTADQTDEDPYRYYTDRRRRRRK